jgi:hypothetical protein
MPRLTGQNAAIDANQSLADSFRSISEGMFKPMDPLTRERLNEAQRRQVSRANAVAALQRGDMQEYYAQSILAAQPGADALAYARQWPGQPPAASTQAVNSQAPAAAPALPTLAPAGPAPCHSQVDAGTIAIP